MVQQSWGSILSPGSTRVPYPPGVQCTYTMELPEGHADQPLSIHFNRFDIAADDYVRVCSDIQLLFFLLINLLFLGVRGLHEGPSSS